MAHELRTPAIGVVAALDGLRQTELTPTQRERLETAHAAARHLLDVVSWMTRAKNGETSVPDELSPRALLEEIASLLRGIAPATRIDVRVGPEVPPVVVARATPLRQIVLNLLGNAVKFAEGGHVSCAAYVAQPGLLEIEVRDDGPGISPDDVPALFEVFVRGASSVGTSGSGIGLALSRAICRSQGGDLEHVPLAQGGACFVARVPIADVAERSAGPLDAAQQLAPRRVLIVDDDTATRALAVGVLRRLGHDVEGCAHAQTALDAMERNAPDLLIVDLELPDMSGLELARRATRAGSNARMVGITAHVLDAVRAQCLEAGMDDVLEKPLDAQQLRAVLARVPSDRA